MFEVGWSEMLVVAVVAIVVVGPKELPKLMRSAGSWVAKARRMASEFQNSLEDMARETELQDLKRTVDDIARKDVGALIDRTVDPKGEIARGIAIEPAPATLAKPADSVAAPAALPAAPPAEPPKAEKAV